MSTRKHPNRAKPSVQPCCADAHRRDRMLYIGTDSRQGGVRIYWCQRCGYLLGDFADCRIEHYTPSILAELAP